MTRYNFIIYGQSNASGRGTGTPPVYAHNDRIFCFKNDNTWAQASEPLDDPTGQVHTYSIDNNAGNGFGMAFADRLCELHPDAEIGLIPCARGSTYMEGFRAHPQESTLYGGMCHRADLAESLGVLSGVLFWQGEAEASDSNAALAQKWPDTFGYLVARSRSDLGKPDLPWVVVRLNNQPLMLAKPNWANLRSRMNELYIRRVVVVSSDDLAYQSDKEHATTAGYVTIGARMADAIDPMVAW